MKKIEANSAGRLATLALSTWVATLAFADASRAADSPLWNRWGLSIGSYFSSTDSNLRVDGITEMGDVGTELDFEDLGLEPSSTVLKARIDHGFAKRHEISVGYHELDRRGTLSVADDIVFEGMVFPAEASIVAELDVRSLELAYTYYLVREKRFGLGLSVGLVGFEIEGSLAARLSIGGEEVEAQRSDASTQLPIPMVGARLRGLVLPRLVFTAHGRFLPEVSVGDYEGSSYLVSVGLEYELIEHLRLGLSYDQFEIDVATEDPDFTGNVNWSEDGALVYLRAVW
jgi:hypothetical protein